MKLNKPFVFTFLSSAIVVCDQVTKSLAPNYFKVLCNKGIAFGIEVGSSLAVLVVLALVFFLLTRERRIIPFLGLSMVFGGGVSNLIDRVNLGCVRDFISVFNFPSFNIADGAITVGVGIVLVNMFIKNK